MYHITPRRENKNKNFEIYREKWGLTKMRFFCDSASKDIVGSSVVVYYECPPSPWYKCEIKNLNTLMGYRNNKFKLSTPMGEEEFKNLNALLERTLIMKLAGI